MYSQFMMHGQANINLTYLLLQQDRCMKFTTCANAYSVIVLPGFYK